MKSTTYNFKIFFILFLFVCGFTSFYAQSISTGTPSPTQICRGSSITVPFVTTGTFQEERFFKLQLSNSSGNFSSLSPNYIGELQVQSTSSDNSVVSRTITGQISSTISTSSNYKVRVVYFSSSSFFPSVIGTTNSQKIKINALPTATITSGGATTFCQGASVVLNANTGAGLTYQWKNNGTNISGAIAASYTASSAGSYTVDVTNSNGCSKTSTSTTVTVNPLTTPTFTQVSAICSGATLSALPTTSNNSIAGSWSPALNNTTTTTYTFTPTSTASPTCARTTTIAITVNALPTATITAGGVTTFCQGASVVLNANTGAGLTYQWKNNGTNISGATAASYTASSAGSYTVVVTNSNGCSKTSTSTTVTVNPLTTPTFTQVSAICSGATLSALPTTSNNSIAGSWSPALNNTTTTTYTFTPTSTASPTCARTTTIAITVNALPTATITAGGATTFCQGASVVLNANTGAGLTYQWKNNSTNISGASAASYTATTAGSYTVVVTNSNGCSKTSTATTVTVNPLTTPTFTQFSAICSGGSFELPTISENGISGTWSPELNFTETTTYTFTPAIGTCANISTMTVVVNPIITPTFNQVASICSGGSFELPEISENGISGSWSPALNNTAITTYTFTPSTGICANATEMTVVVNPIVTPTFNEISSICFGESVSDFPETSTNGISGTWLPLAINNHHTTTYTFTPNNDFCATSISETLVVNPIITIDTTVISCLSYTWPANDQTYTVSGNYTYVSGCTTRTLNLTITQPSVLGAPSIIEGTSNGLCLSGITNPSFSVSSVVGATSYEWTVPTGATIVSGQGTNSVTLNITGVFTLGTLSVKAMDVCTTSVARTTTIRGVLATPGTLTGTLTGLCVNGDSNPSYIAATVAGATSYTWTSPAGTTIANGQGTTSISLNVTSGFTSGFVTVAANNACGSSVVKTLAVNSVTLMPGVISGTSVGLGVNCIPTATFTTTNVVGATDYVWTVPTGATIVSGAGTNTITLSFNSLFISGGLSVFARNACGNSPTRTLSLYSVPTTPGTITGTSTGLCSQGISTATYSIAAVNGASNYTWTAPSGTSIVSGQGTTSIVLNFNSGFTSGTLKVSSSNSCGSSLAKTLVLNSVPLTPGVVTGTTNNLCTSGVSNPTYSIVAVAGATSYTWTAPTGMTITSGQGTTSVGLNVTESFVSGYLKLVANNACGSSVVKSVTLTSTPLTPASITGSATPCGTETYTCATVAQAVSYTWTVPTGLEIISGQGTNTITVNVISSTVLGSITVKASNNCKTGAAKSMVVSSCTAKSMLTTTEETITNDNTNKIEAVVYPNPTSGEVNIEFTNELEENVTVELFDMIGNKVSRVNMPNGSTVGNLTLEGMTSGMYLLQVVNSNNDIIYKSKVSKQ